MAYTIDPADLATAEKELAEYGGVARLALLMTVPAFAARLRAHLTEDAVIPEVLAAYAITFTDALNACEFASYDTAGITPENFPGEMFVGGDYDLRHRELPAKSNGYNADQIDQIIADWMKEEKTILGSASAGDGIFFSKQVAVHRKHQPDGWIVCPGSTSVDDRLLYLLRLGADRRSHVYTRGGRWSANERVLLRVADTT